MNSIREAFEIREQGFIAPQGCLSTSSRGRLKPEAPCPIRTAFQVDRDRIVYANAFRRLKHKTQVFLAPLDEQYRTRLTHTLEVAQIARNISRALRLNEDLAEAVALGHDLGHTPFGHGGEVVLKELYGPDFSHQVQGLRVVDVLERGGEGLNLTHEVRDGILKHSKGHGPILAEDPQERACTLEGDIVRIADIMAYLNHDLDDAIRSGVITEDLVPASCKQILGQTHAQRATAMIRDLVYNSLKPDGRIELGMSEPVYAAMVALRRFLYDHVYQAPQLHREFVKAKKILNELFEFYGKHSDELEKELAKLDLAGLNGLGDPGDPGDPGDHGEPDPKRKLCDFLASLTDSHAMELFQQIHLPKPVLAKSMLAL
jgi:dGTPase